MPQLPIALTLLAVSAATACTGPIHGEVLPPDAAFGSGADAETPAEVVDAGPGEDAGATPPADDDAGLSPSREDAGPPVETCNGIDDDVDGSVDEGVRDLIVTGDLGVVRSPVQLVPGEDGELWAFATDDDGLNAYLLDEHARPAAAPARIVIGTLNRFAVTYDSLGPSARWILAWQYEDRLVAAMVSPDFSEVLLPPTAIGGPVRPIEHLRVAANAEYVLLVWSDGGPFPNIHARSVFRGAGGGLEVLSREWNVDSFDYDSTRSAIDLARRGRQFVLLYSGRTLISRRHAVHAMTINESGFPLFWTDVDESAEEAIQPALCVRPEFPYWMGAAWLRTLPGATSPAYLSFDSTAEVDWHLDRTIAGAAVRPGGGSGRPVVAVTYDCVDEAWLVAFPHATADGTYRARLHVDGSRTLEASCSSASGGCSPAGEAVHDVALASVCGRGTVLVARHVDDHARTYDYGCAAR